jgi:hypothetical protein
MCPINSDEHDAEHGVRSGPEQPLATEQSDEPGASSYQQDNSPEKQGRVCERSAMKVSASEPECSGDEQSRLISGQQDAMVPALSMVGRTPGWAVREIICIVCKMEMARDLVN